MLIYKLTGTDPKAPNDPSPEVFFTERETARTVAKTFHTLPGRSHVQWVIEEVYVYEPENALNDLIDIVKRT